MTYRIRARTVQCYPRDTTENVICSVEKSSRLPSGRITTHGCVQTGRVIPTTSFDLAFARMIFIRKTYR